MFVCVTLNKIGREQSSRLYPPPEMTKMSIILHNVTF